VVESGSPANDKSTLELVKRRPGRRFGRARESAQVIALVLRGSNIEAAGSEGPMGEHVDGLLDDLANNEPDELVGQAVHGEVCALSDGRSQLASGDAR
jgi:hypothetical protein